MAPLKKSWKGERFFLNFKLLDTGQVRETNKIQI